MEDEYPRGKLRPDDKGQMPMAITVNQDCVVIMFKYPVTWIGLPAELAEELARILVINAKEAKKNRQ